MRAASGVLASLLDLVLPPRCAACARATWAEERPPLCAACRAAFDDGTLRCPRCGRRTGPRAASAGCARCMGPRAEPDAFGRAAGRVRPLLAGVTVAATYEGAPRDLVLALKFRRRPEAAAPLARLLADALVDAGVPGDLVVPVPLSRRRRLGRHYDQARLLAVPVARALDLPVDSRALVRVRHTRPQTRLGGRQRLGGPRGAFRARPARVRGRCVLLVDDVLTTGATLHAAALALGRAGAASIHAAVACRSESF